MPLMLRSRESEMLERPESGVAVGNVGKSESEILERSELVSDILPPTSQPYLGCMNFLCNFNCFLEKKKQTSKYFVAKLFWVLTQE